MNLHDERDAASFGIRTNRAAVALHPQIMRRTAILPREIEAVRGRGTCSFSSTKALDGGEVRDD